MSAVDIFKATADEVSYWVEQADDPMVAAILQSIHWAKLEHNVEEEVKAVEELTELLVLVRGQY